eukprot:5667562-Pyramimonas_sp.AAC.1
MKTKRAEVQDSYPCSSLRLVIERWLSFCASTSGVEQGFAVGQVAVSDRPNADPQLELNYLK